MVVSFVLRLTPSLLIEDGRVVGEVEAVGSTRRRAVSDLDDLVGFLTRECAAEAAEHG